MWLFSFENSEDRDWVCRNQPWHFDSHLFAVKMLNGLEQPSAIRITTVPLWVRAYDLPLICLTDRVIHVLAAKVGVLQYYDKTLDQISETFLRFKVEIDFTKPLKRGIHIRMEGVGYGYHSNMRAFRPTVSTVE